MAYMKLGDRLVELGVLTDQQRDDILEAQRGRARPFGVLAEELFGVCPRVIERAWADQIDSLQHRVVPIDEQPTPDALARVERRQAWQFRFVPLRHEDGALIVCTTPEHLPRASRFSAWRVDGPVHFVLASEDDLAAALAEYYPMAQLSGGDSLLAS
ncbi:MAG: hypothetical protein AAGG07_09830 [Planctomycetota bacterium]